MISIEPGETKEGLPNAKIIFQDKQATLHSRMPYKEAERIASRFNQSLKHVIIVGFGLGYIVEYLAQKTDYQVIVFDLTPEVIEYSKKTRDTDSILNHKKVHFFSDENLLFQYLESYYIKELNFYVHRPYMTLFPEKYSGIEGRLIAYLSKKQINQATLNRFQKVWLRNVIKNSAYYFNTPGIKDIKHSFMGKPAIIVGAGPSLAKNIDLIKEYQDYAIIISTDTALPMLTSKGIAPDFTVSVDPQNKNAQYLLYSECANTTLVLDSAASYISISKYKPRQTLLFDSVFPLYQAISGYWKEKGQLKSGGSVSTTAFDLARYFNADPIILVGQDLSFTGKQTHYEGNILEEFLYYRIDRFNTYEKYNLQSLFKSDKIPVDGWEGRKVFTDRKFMTFLDWFKREIKETAQKVINCTEGGVNIDGAENDSFSKTAKLYFKNKIDKRYEILFDENSDADYKKFLNSLNNQCEELIGFSKKACSAAKQAAVAYKNNQSIQKYNKDMSRFDKNILLKIKEGSPIARMIEFTMQESINQLMESAIQGQLSVDTINNWIEIYEKSYLGLKTLQQILLKRKYL